jgi:hypothetical protein
MSAQAQQREQQLHNLVMLLQSPDPLKREKSALEIDWILKHSPELRTIEVMHPLTNFWLSQLQHPDWRKRERAAVYLTNLQPEFMNDTVRIALISELEKQFEKIRKGDFEPCLDCDDGGEEGYYSWLFEAIAKMRDERALPLFSRIGSPTALAYYGERGIRVVLDNLKRTGVRGASGTIVILSRVVDRERGGFAGYVATGEVLKEIKESLIMAAKDSIADDLVRVFGIRGLKNIGEGDVLPILEAIAMTDKNTNVQAEARSAIQALKRK